jgi:hypothetical protein
VLCATSAIALMAATVSLFSATAQSPPTAIAFTNGRWFDGNAFQPRPAVYSIDARLSFAAPVRVDQTIDLAGAWVVPPFADAHNHNLSNGASDAADRDAVRRFLYDGVFYVKIPGNVPPSAQARRDLGINTPSGLDVSFGHGSITSSNGHPMPLVTSLAAAGSFTGHTPESLRDLRYFAVDSEPDLAAKWPLILRHRPDFIKAMLVFSEDHDKNERDPSATPDVGRTARKGLDPRLLGAVVARAHASGLRVSVHVNSATDFRNAVAASVDEINHLPPRRSATLDEDTTFTAQDAANAAGRGIIVVTTLALPATIPDATRVTLRQRQQASLRIMRDAGVRLAIGTDNPDDTSVQEAIYVHGLGVDRLTVLKMWTDTAPLTIFPGRRIGALREGYEASFLALAGDPLTDLENVRRIRLRVKQGTVLAP